MIDGIFTKQHRRHVKDLNIVPILDMLTTIIFFLLLSTSFLEFTKVTVPPSQTSVSVSTATTLPVAPKMLLVERSEGLRMVLTWGGEKPGETMETIRADSDQKRRVDIIEAGRKLTSDFAKTHPSEKTLQLGLGARVKYQDLISAMDGVRDSMPDIVLISHHEAEARGR